MQMDESSENIQDESATRDPLWSQAYQSMTRRLGARDHSEKELRTKLLVRFPKVLVDEMIELAKKHRWLREPADLATRTVERLSAKGKGSFYIANQLRKLGLPQAAVSHEQELAAALATATNRFGDWQDASFEEKAQIMRFLSSRGFNREVINEVIFKTPTRESK